ncbi:BQ5605_C002g01167 [Microbotryum silenes-dioicae]|uniref:BQ5605_C002g01167 protein n=1 Tax=Microbotryum silenes-dioicae TaxID=796604 RepID=A0A2X0MST0_9BASI|nr:BQ5605_C002g01167 [Microbotryum silenes-dioicae]
MSSLKSQLSEIKQGQIQNLSQQLATLAQQTAKLEHLTVATAEQASYLRLLGAYHAAWFMSAARIMTSEDDASQAPPTQTPTAEA